MQGQKLFFVIDDFYGKAVLAGVPSYAATAGISL